MVIRKFVIAIVAKYSGKGWDEAEADLDGVKRSARGADKGLTDLQKSARKAKEEARALAKEEREATKALKAQARETDRAVKANQRLAKVNAARLAKGFAKREKEAAAAQRAQAKAMRDQARATEKAANAAKRLAAANEKVRARELAKNTKMAAAAIKAQGKAADKTALANKRLRESQERASLVALGLARAEDKAGDETRKAAAEARKASSSWSTVGAQFAGVGAAAGGVALALGAAVAPVLLIGAKFQSLRAQLDNLLGSAAAGEKAFGFIQEFAVKTPFMLDEVTGAFIALEGRGIKPTERRMKALGDIAASTLGKTFDDIVQAALDASAGEGERLREFGITMKKAGDDVSLSFRGQTLAVKNNKMAITDALVTLGEMNGIAGAMAVQMNTLTGQFSNARGSVEKFLNSASKAGGLERTGEILTLLGDKLIKPKNARLFGEAINEILTTIRDGIKDIEPGTITAGFQALLNVIKLLAIALKPFIALWRVGIGLLNQIDTVTDSVLRLAEAFEELVTGQIFLEDAVTKTAMAFGLIEDKTKTATLGMDVLRKKALAAVDAVKSAITGAFIKDASEEELKAIAANENASASQRALATKELSERKEKVKKTKATGARREDVARKDFEQRREKTDKKGRKGKGGSKGKFFDFAAEARSAAKSQGEDFAAEELERLVSSGVGFDEAQVQARAAGKERAKEREARFKKTGKISKAGGGKNILDVLGLKGPGSVLADRPAPASVIIAPQIKFTMIENFTQTIGDVTGAKGLEEVTGEAGRAASEAGLGEFQKRAEKIFAAMMDLQVNRLVKTMAGGRLPPGPEG